MAVVLPTELEIRSFPAGRDLNELVAAVMPDGFGPSRTWDPSWRVDHAWEVVGAFARQPGWLPDIYGRGDDTWGVAVRDRVLCTGHFLASAEAPAMPLAVCRAYLLAARRHRAAGGAEVPPPVRPDRDEAKRLAVEDVIKAVTAGDKVGLLAADGAAKVGVTPFVHEVRLSVADRLLVLTAAAMASAGNHTPEWAVERGREALAELERGGGR